MSFADFFGETNMSNLASKQEREIWVRGSKLPEGEMRIARTFDLTHGEKMEKLTALRNAKATQRAARRAPRTAQSTPKTFEQMIDASEAIRARGLAYS